MSTVVATHDDQPASNLRTYDVETDRLNTVQEFYYNKNSHQTFEYASKMLAKYTTFGSGPKRSMEDALEYCENIVDDSDPDTEASQLQHAMQTAEACRRHFPDLDWLHLTGLIHDTGKVLVIPDMGGLQQWEVVGDTYPVGCAFSEHIVYPEAFKHNPDTQNPKYSTATGVYKEKCGLRNVTMAFGHDEYLYYVLKNHPRCTLPAEALYIIRYHSFYPWHDKGAYTDLCDEEDMAVLPLVQKFQKCDLYSKADHPLKWEGELKAYYTGLIEKYIPGLIQW